MTNWRPYRGGPGDLWTEYRAASLASVATWSLASRRNRLDFRSIQCNWLHYPRVGQRGRMRRSSALTSWRTKLNRPLRAGADHTSRRPLDTTARIGGEAR